MRILEEKADTKRPSIVAAATSLFAKRGIDATSMRDVADAAGVREAAIYRHFPGKEQLALQIFSSWYGWYSQQVSEIVVSEVSLREKLGALVRLEFDAARDYPEEFLYFRENETRFLRKMGKEIPRVRANLIELVRDGQRRLQVRLGDCGVLADMLSGALCAVAISAIRRKTVGSLKRQVEMAAESCWQMIGRGK